MEAFFKLDAAYGDKLQMIPGTARARVRSHRAALNGSHRRAAVRAEFAADKQEAKAGGASDGLQLSAAIFALRGIAGDNRPARRTMESARFHGPKE